MSIFKYTKGEKEINKVIKHNQLLSEDIEKEMADTRAAADDVIAESEALLRSLGMGKQVDEARASAHATAEKTSFTNHPEAMTWDEILSEANARIPQEVVLEDILTPDEIQSAFREAEEINAAFAEKTSIVNKTDLCFLAIATALQTIKAVLYPYIAQKFGYGSSFDPKNRMAHNDKTIENAHRAANRKFVSHHQKHNPNGYWINMVYQTVPYDAIKGSKDALGTGLSGNDHRLHTLGHDPILGWFFGTMNILTDTVTLNTFQTYRVTRKPLMITPQQVDPITLLTESADMIQGDKLNLPAAIFTQAAHLKSDLYTKQGLPVPVLSTFSENFASDLYKNQYDALCLARDAKFIAGSAGISILIDIIISLIHGLYYSPEKDGDRNLYEVRTRKIILISNSIASTSSVIAAAITENPAQLDIGSLLVTIGHLFSDVRFIARIKQEFIENEINKRLQVELDELDALYQNMM